MKKLYYSGMLAIATLLGASVFQSCEKHNDNHQHNNEGEVITKVEIYLSAGDSILIREVWSDKDGIGGNNPVLPDTLILQKNKTYIGFIKFYTNHDDTSFHDVTNDIKTEGTEHIICYNVQSITMPPTGLAILRTDDDVNHKVLGFDTEWLTPASIDLGLVNIRLKHQPGIKDGTCDPGETDVEVNFPYLVK